MKTLKNMLTERPLDFLDNLREKKVTIACKNDKNFVGILKAFDIHINIVLLVNNKELFIRGDEVFFIEQNE